MICQVCGKEFEPKSLKTSNAKYCSFECRAIVKRAYTKAQNERLRQETLAKDNTRKCQLCGEPFQSGHGKVYCSETCQRKAHRRTMKGETLKPEPPRKKKCKGLDGLEKQLKKQGNFYEEYHKWKLAQAFKNVTPIIIDIVKENR